MPYSLHIGSEGVQVNCCKITHYSTACIINVSLGKEAASLISQLADAACKPAQEYSALFSWATTLLSVHGNPS